jgi:hypothetical protein
MISPICHPFRLHAAHGLCRSCYRRRHRPVPVDVASRMRAVHEADEVLERSVYAAREWAQSDVFYDEILLRAMRRRKEEAARIDAEWRVAGGTERVLSD